MKQFKLILSLILTLVAIVGIITQSKAQGLIKTQSGKLLADTTHWNLSFSTPNESYILMSLHGNEIEIRGDTVECIRRLINEYSELAKQFRLECELNEKYRTAWDNYLRAIRIYKKVKNRVIYATKR